MRLNYYLALVFGLIHGMGFANTARLMMAQEQNIFTPLLGFNIGLELGQVVVVLIILLVEFLLIQFLKLKKIYWMVFASAVTVGLADGSGLSFEGEGQREIKGLDRPIQVYRLL